MINPTWRHTGPREQVQIHSISLKKKMEGGSERNMVILCEKYKPDCSQIHIKVEYWMPRGFHSKHIESDL